MRVDSQELRVVTFRKSRGLIPRLPTGLIEINYHLLVLKVVVNAQTLTVVSGEDIIWGSIFWA